MRGAEVDTYVQHINECALGVCWHLTQEIVSSAGEVFTTLKIL